MRISDWSSDVCSSDLRVHDRPAQIVVELARELKQSKKRKDEIQKEQAENQKKNDKRREKLAALGLPDTGEKDRKSVVSGKSVSVRVDLGGRRIIKKKKNIHM